MKSFTDLEKLAKLHPDRPDVLLQLANAYRAVGRNADAHAAYSQLVSIAPNHRDAWVNIGYLSQSAGRLSDAMRAYGRALQIDPRLPAVHNNCGVILTSAQRYQEALRHYDRAIALDKAVSDFWANRGFAMQKLGRLDEALSSYSVALQLNPLHTEALRNSGNALSMRSEYARASAMFARLVEAKPDAPYVFGTMIHTRLLASDWTDYDENVARLQAEMLRSSAVIPPFELLSIVDSPSLQLDCAKAFFANRFPTPATPAYAGSPRKEGRIRLAYVSGDFRNHAMPLLMAGVFEKHDRARFEVVAYSFGPEEDSNIRKRLKSAFDEFVDVSNVPDRRVAEMFVEREIDIAIDLMGLTRNARCGIFANRGAPVQVAYLGYPGTMGSSAYDYVLVDDFIAGEGREDAFAEKLVRLPECFQANDDARELPGPPPTRASQGLPETGFVFCSFNNSYKVNPPVFDIWMRLLRQVPQSVLWMVADSTDAQNNLRRETSARSVSPERLVFATRRPYPEHLARLQLGDLFLDTFPFGAGTTASDAIWAGLPLISLTGQSFASRMAGSLMTAIGAPELACRSSDEYEATAVDLALNPSKLKALKERITEGRKSLFDTSRFVRDLESAYIDMVERSRQGLAPESFRVRAMPGYRNGESNRP